MTGQTSSAGSGSKAASARLEATLPDGAVIAVEVRESPRAQELAQAAIDLIDIHLDKKARAAAAGEATSAQGHGIVGASPPMMELFRLLERIRGSNATVLISGENGTGKELVAKAIHQQSGRAKKRFVATNCSAFNDNLLESELFGHKRGSFTGAVVDKPGLFEVADGGTFFLDEVGDMSPALQVKLLRVLQEGVFMPVGATEQRKVDVRIVAATNRELAAMVKNGQFREDLYYRLHVVALRVAPLRERREDIAVLVDHFMRRLAERDGVKKAIGQQAMARLVEHEWPGNVRELENEIERLWVLSGDDHVIGEEHLTPSIRESGSRPAAPALPGRPPVEAAAPTQTLPEAVEALEREIIAAQLRRARGNKTKAAEELGISRRNLIRKVQAYGLESTLGPSGEKGSDDG